MSLSLLTVYSLSEFSTTVDFRQSIALTSCSGRHFPISLADSKFNSLILQPLPADLSLSVGSDLLHFFT